MNQIKKILIANRGEIALRIIRACKEMNIISVVIFSEADIEGAWLKKADECYPLLGDPIKAYLDYERIIATAKKANCDAIHPGYGFLSEDADFAQCCQDNNLIFIGPKPEHIALFGDKIASKRAVKDIGVPILPGTDAPITNTQEALHVAEDIGFPVIIKAAFGGGGRGMRIVHKADEFQSMYEDATNESKKFFGKDEMFIEKYLSNPHHIEVQILADKYGNVLHLGNRDCSIQRRHQKILEIAPSPYLKASVKEKLYEISLLAIKKLGYESVATIEFLVDDFDNIYFIEINTRIQVEHPITEMVSGIDLVEQMIEVAQAKKLTLKQKDITIRGYAIEFRINAEDPNHNFTPSPGKLTEYLAPGGPGVRLDSIAYQDYTISHFYDSLIAKLIVWGISWEEVVKKSKRALDEFLIAGVPTNISLHRQIVKDNDFAHGHFNTGYLEKKLSLFNLEVVDDIKKEQEKMQHITEVIDAIKRNHLNVRY